MPKDTTVANAKFSYIFNKTKITMNMKIDDECWADLGRSDVFVPKITSKSIG